MSNFLKSFKFKFFRLLVVLLIILQILDGTCTYIGVSQYGVGIEGNPLIVLSIIYFGQFLGLLIPKTIGIFLILWAYSMIKRFGSMSNVGLAIFVLINIFYSLVVYVWISFLLFGIE